MERLPDALRAQTLRQLKSIQADEMAVDLDESSAMEVDNENARLKKRLLPPLFVSVTFFLSPNFLFMILGQQ